MSETTIKATKKAIKIIAVDAHQSSVSRPNALNSLNTLEIANDVDPRTLDLNGVQRIDLHFPKFTDGRAFSLAFLLRHRLGFAGEIRATGDVLIDQLLQMQRCGFDSAVLRPDQDPALAARQLTHFTEFYQ